MEYIRRIDSLRAFAVIMVVISHWTPFVSKIIPLGEIGVDIFFVISGFLITRILLVERENSIKENSPKRNVLKNFIARRALRIFPIYYFSLFLFWILQDYQGYHIRENLIYYLTYTSNVLFYIQKSWDGFLAPLWSLAVEEQFYLVWPLIIVIVNRQYSFVVIVLSILVGILSPLFFEHDMSKVLTPTCLNALGGGALLAWFLQNKKDALVKYRAIIFGVSILAVLSLIVILIFKVNFLNNQIRTLIAIPTVVVIMYCIDIYKPIHWIDLVLKNRLLIFIGQISYGIYLYHNLVTICFQNFVGFLGDVPNIVWILLKFFVLIVWSWVSYRFIELPFLKLKKHFN